MHYLIGFFSTFLTTPYISPHQFLQCIMPVSISIIIMHVTVSVVAMLCDSFKQQLYISLSDRQIVLHFSQFAFNQFCKYSSKIKIQYGWKLYLNQLKEPFSTFFSQQAYKRWGHPGFLEGGDFRKGGLDLQKRGYELPYQL